MRIYNIEVWGCPAQGLDPWGSVQLGPFYNSVIPRFAVLRWGVWRELAQLNRRLSDQNPLFWVDPDAGRQVRFAGVGWTVNTVRGAGFSDGREWNPPQNTQRLVRWSWAGALAFPVLSWSHTRNELEGSGRYFHCNPQNHPPAPSPETPYFPLVLHRINPAQNGALFLCLGFSLGYTYPCDSVKKEIRIKTLNI